MDRKSNVWQNSAVRFIQSLNVNETYPSVSNGDATLYGTCYDTLATWYLGAVDTIADSTKEFLKRHQSSQDGFFIGPELLAFDPTDARNTGDL